MFASLWRRLFGAPAAPAPRSAATRRKPLRPPAARLPTAAEAFTLPALERAFSRVKANRGGPGADGVTIDMFDRTRAQRLAQLSAALTLGAWRPGPMRAARAPRPDGGERPLLIPTVADRVAATALTQALSPALEPRWSASSYGYRVGRGVAEAVAEARRLRRDGLVVVTVLDIARFFEAVRHRAALRAFAASVPDDGFRAFVSAWLDAAAPSGRGLPQGAPLSPLLANMTLDSFDRAMEDAGVTFIRYVDNIALFSADAEQARAHLDRARAALADLSLSLNAAKTRVATARDSVTFLGETIAPAQRGLLRRAA